MDSSIQVCRAAVRTNYFPLWESVDGQFKMTHNVNKPKPIREMTDLLGKYRHLNEENMAILQGQVNKRYKTLQALCKRL